MATDRLINQTQGEDIIDQLQDIAANVGNITYGPQTSADKVVSMTGYQKASTEAAISQGDTLNEAVGKLEKKADDAITGLGNKLDATANAASAAKLNNGSSDYSVGSTTKGVYFNNGVPTEMTYSVGTNVPVDAVFTDTTYTNGSGITIGNGNAINHSNSVSEQTTVSALKVSYDAQGHITGSSALAASDIGLGNVGNFLAVSTVANQGLTPTEQQNARNNINIASNTTTIKSATTNNTVVNGFSTSSVSGKDLYTYDSTNERLTFNFLSYSTGDAIGTTDVSVYAVES